MKRTLVVGVLVATMALLAHGQRPVAAGVQSPGIKRVIISTDIAAGLKGGWRAGVSDIDDGLAVAMALTHRSLGVRGIVVTFGNNDVEPAMVVADRIVRRLMKSRVPVLRGAAVRLSNPQVGWSFEDGSLKSVCLNEGVRFLAGELRKGPLTLIAIGPLTDVACLVQNYPVEAARITEVIAIMGRNPGQAFAIGGVTGLTDFNHVMDNRAVEVILQESSIPMTFVTFSLTSGSFVPRAAVNRYRRLNTPLAGFVIQSVDQWITQWNGIFHEDGFHPWDQNAVYYAANPFTVEQARPQIVPCASGPHDPYNRDPRCAGHGPDQKPSLDKETSQLWLSAGGTLRRVRVIRAYANDTAKQEFMNSIFRFLH